VTSNFVSLSVQKANIAFNTKRRGGGGNANWLVEDPEDGGTSVLRNVGIL
jgi:hypothetical protein